MLKSGNIPPMSLNSAASSSSLYSTHTTGSSSNSNTGGSFPAMPPSPATAAAPEHICFLTTEPATTTAAQQKCFSPAAAGRCSSRVNLEGSWLDLESDAECDSSDTYSLMRMRRKSSGASSKGSSSVHAGGRIALAANLKELTRRSSMHLRKLTAKMGSAGTTTSSS
ncbi:hypothetical protein IWW38_004839 [Coemansia aciculifera]|uniref:Uncharacterized protein n=1 Tax=Coemansia aciculifera TaxID=417176 RepID=A0ACC1LYA3_9FUNG|nr:hypothetical protein IWW38_004839 [Coemansia aciculifera]